MSREIDRTERERFAIQQLSLVTARARWADYEGSTADLDRDESRSAARFDNRGLRRISGLRYEADRVPHESDVEDYE